MSIHDYRASLDLKQNLNIYTTCKQLDNLNLILTIFDNSLQADLTNYDVRLRAMKSDEVALIQEHTGITINNNIVTINCHEQLTTTPGNTLVELQFINKTTGIKKATFNLVLQVYPSSISINNTISTATYTLLQELENKIDQASDFFEHIGEAIEANTNLETTIANSETAKNNLDGSILAGNTLKESLNNIISTGSILKTNLENDISTGNTLKEDLESTISTGDSLLSSLETFEQEHADVTDISNQLASVNTQLSEMMKLIDYKNKQAISLNKFYEKVANGTARKICCLGTSMTYGQDTSSSDKRPVMSDPTLDTSYTNIVTQAGKTYPEAFQEYMNYVYGNGIVTILNRGVSGLRTNTALSIWTTNPNADLHLIELGTNDTNGDITSFTNNYIELIKRILDWGSAVVLLTSPKHALDSSVLLEGYRKAVKNIGKLFGIPVIDCNEFLRGYATYEVQATGDATHYNTKGYTVWGTKIASCFIGITDLDNPYTLNVSKQLPISFSEYGNVTNGIVQGQYQGENGIGELKDYGMRVTLTNGQKYIMSFYTEEENTLLIPLLNLWDGATCHVKLDFGIEQPVETNNIIIDGTGKSNILSFNSLLDFTASQNHSNISSITMNDINSKVLQIVGKGWHSIEIENTSSVGNLDFMGFAVYSYQDFKSINFAKTPLTISQLNSKLTINSYKCIKIDKMITVMCNFTVTSSLIQYDTMFLIGGISAYVDNYLVDKTLGIQITDNDAGTLVFKEISSTGLANGTYDLVTSFIIN